MRLLDIDRTATFAISNHNLPYVATANVAGAIDADFSDSAKLEIWNPFAKDNKKPIRSIEIESKVYDLVWSENNKMLVGGLENGSLQFWDSEKLLSDSENNSSESVSLHVAKNHTASVKSLAFNHTKSNVLLSGSANNEIYIWDTNKLSADPMTPTGSNNNNSNNNGKPAAVKSTEEVNALAWNYVVSHIFASASSSGIASVWDLKSKRKVLNLSHTEATQHGNIRANLSSVVWHPTQSTKLVTASDLDNLPVILQWDLRFSKTPELVFGGAQNKGHSKGVLSVDWLAQDSDFLVTSGKDANTYLWDTTNGDLVASYPLHSRGATINAIGTSASSDWVFKTRFAHNPEYFATASFDGHVTFQTIQDTSSNLPEEEAVSKTETEKKPIASETDFWNQVSSDSTLEPEAEIKEVVKPEIFVKKAPKWLKRPNTASFAFGGVLIKVKPANSGSQIEIVKMKSNEDDGLEKLEKIVEGEGFTEFLEKKLSETESYDWKILKELQDLGTEKLLLKYIKEDEAKEEKDLNGDSDDFFANLGAFKPESEKFEIFEDSDKDSVKNTLKKHVLCGNFAKAVDLALHEEFIIEAFIIAKNSQDDKLTKKVLGHYFEENINKKKDSLARLLYATSSGSTIASDSGNESSDGLHIDDLIENGSVDNWKEIALGINTYIKDKALFNSKITQLGDRVYESGSRNDAVLLYLCGGSLNKISEIWLSELKKDEKDIVKNKSSESKDKHASLLDLYYKLLDELVIKLVIFKKSLSIEGEFPDSENYAKLNQIFLDYAKYIGETYGKFSLIAKILQLLPSSSSEVDLFKKRLGLGKPVVSKIATGANKYGAKTAASKFAPRAVGVSASPVMTGSSVSRFTPVGTPGASNLTPQVQSVPPPISNNGASAASKRSGRPKYAIADISTNPGSSYAPPNAAVSASPYAPQTAASSASPYAPPNAVVSASPYAPPNATASAYAPSLAATPASSAVPTGPINGLGAPPSSSRFSSAQNPAKVKKGSNEGWNDLPDVFNDVLKKSAKKKAAPVTVSRSFSPIANTNPLSPTNQPPPSFSRKTSFVTGPPPKGRSGSSASGSATTSALNSPKLAPASVNKYAPVQSPINSSVPPTMGQHYGAVPPPQSFAPRGGMYNPPPQNFPSAGPSTPSPVSVPPPPQFKSANSVPAHEHTQATGPPPKLNKSKHPSGDRSHISAVAMPIFTNLSQELEAVKPKIPEKYAKKIHDTEKRLNVLFDMLNNDEISDSIIIENLVKLSTALVSKDYATAQNLSDEVATSFAGKSNWVIGLKRLIDMSEATNN